MNFCASSKHLQTERFLETLRAYFLEVERMMKELYREANRRPNNVRLLFLSLSSSLADARLQTFVDHHVGEVDARTGKPLSHLRRGSNEPHDPEEDFSGYGFYGSLDAVCPRSYLFRARADWLTRRISRMRWTFRGRRDRGARLRRGRGFRRSSFESSSWICRNFFRGGHEL